MLLSLCTRDVNISLKTHFIRTKTLIFPRPTRQFDWCGFSAHRDPYESIYLERPTLISSFIWTELEVHTINFLRDFIYAGPPTTPPPVSFHTDPSILPSHAHHPPGKKRPASVLPSSPQRLPLDLFISFFYFILEISPGFGLIFFFFF